MIIIGIFFHKKKKILINFFSVTHKVYEHEVGARI